MKTINVLWTGGLDSTYLLFRLSELPFDIQPYYIIDPHRLSTRKEFEALDKISAALSKRKDIKGTIQQVKKINMDDIQQYADTDEAWNTLNQKFKLGSQYLFLANFARQYDIRLATGVLLYDLDLSNGLIFGDRSKVEESLKGIQFINADAFPELFLQVKDSGKNLASFTTFERLYFPKFMTNVEKPSEWEYLQEHDAKDIAQMTWFCHRPVLGMTCGHCYPSRMRSMKEWHGECQNWDIHLI